MFSGEADSYSSESLVNDFAEGHGEFDMANSRFLPSIEIGLMKKTDEDL